MVFGWLEAIVADRRGNFAVMVGILSIPILGGCGIAVDFALMSQQRSMLQSAADLAALASARELGLINAKSETIANIAKTYVRSNFDPGDEISGDATELTVETKVDKDKRQVEVTISYHWAPILLKYLDSRVTPMNVSATARLVGETNVCVIGLDKVAGQTVSLDSNSSLNASNCAVFSNSKAKQGLSSLSNAYLKAEYICSSGGKAGSQSNYSKAPITDCPQILDPLAGRSPPMVGTCDSTNLEVIDKTVTLYPGVYCGGLRIDGNAVVHFAPGVYVIKDGIFNVDSNSQIEGTNVGFYLTGNQSTFRFASNATVNLTAPKDGEMAGLLFYEEPGSTVLRRFEILSNYARILVGTIYLPHGRFIVDADNNVADQSAYTAIVARRVELYASAKLVLNTDYHLTSVPVPDGLGGGNKPTLVK